MLCFATPLWACETDATVMADRDKPITSPQTHRYSEQKLPYSFQIKQIAIPITLFTVASTTLYIKEIKQWNTDAQILISSDKKFEHDDWFQYAPIATMWGLNICGVRSRHRFAEQTTTLALAIAFNAAMVNSLKYTIKYKRPNSETYNSFPSGHTATAFMGAEFLRMEYRDTSPWIGLSGYCFAVATGYLRIHNGRHYLSDVMAGSAVGILSVKMAYWVAPTINKLLWGSDLNNPKSSRRGSYRAVSPYASGDGAGVSFVASF